MNFDDALKRYWPTAWFRFKFFKYKYRGRGEPELKLIRHLVTPGSTALDVGCSIGMYAAEMSRYAGRVIAFEANPRVAAFTAHVTPRNVEVVNVALSSAPGRTILRVPLGGKGSINELGTIEPASPMHGIAGDSVEVDMKRLDDFRIANCSFIKIDVEAHEDAMLDGAAQLIATQRPILMIELDEWVNPGTVQRVGTRLAAQHYRGLFLSRGTMRPLTEFNVATHQDPDLVQRYTRKTLPAHLEYINNFVFVPEEKARPILARL